MDAATDLVVTGGELTVRAVASDDISAHGLKEGGFGGGPGGGGDDRGSRGSSGGGPLRGARGAGPR